MSQQHVPQLPLDSLLFETSTGSWTARVTSDPIVVATNTLLAYQLEFVGKSSRRLRLVLPMEKFALEKVTGESTLECAKQAIYRWLEGSEETGKIQVR